MKTNMKRREAITKAAVVVGSLLAFKGLAAPASKHNISFVGGWFYLGQPCAIFQEGSILLAVNEVGSLATALITAPDSLLIWGGSGWDSGLTAVMVNGGRALNWSNGTVWTRS